MIKVLNLENAPLSDRNGSYGGAAGSKEGILIDREYWLVNILKVPEACEAHYCPIPLRLCRNI